MTEMPPMSETRANNINNIRQFIMDTQVDHDPHILALLGVTPISDEVLETEDRASTERLLRIRHLLPAISSYANVLATGLTAHEQAHTPEEIQERLPEGVWDAHQRSLHTFGLNVLMGTLSQLVEKGLLQVPTRQEAAPKRKTLFRR